MVELVTRMMELKKQQARAPLPVRACLSENARRQARTQTGKKQSPSVKQLLDQKLAIKEGLPPTADGFQLTAWVVRRSFVYREFAVISPQVAVLAVTRI